MHYWTESINKNLHSFVRKALKKFLLPQLLPVLPWPLAPPALHQGGNGAPRKLVHCTFFNTSAPIFNLQPEFLLDQGVIDSALTKNGQDHPDLDPDPPPALRRRLHRVHHLHCSLLRPSHHAWAAAPVISLFNYLSAGHLIWIKKASWTVIVLEILLCSRWEWKVKRLAQKIAEENICLATCHRQKLVGFFLQMLTLFPANSKHLQTYLSK